MALGPGQTLSFYEILDPLGAGGMGEVWRARDTRLGREVAIKVLPETLADDAERLQRFEREARALASLSHPHVAQVYGIDQVEATCFMAMELVPGEDLSARIARGPLPVDEALEVCRQIAEGLESAHEAGVIHRDLKPANVRATPDGVVKLLDFGLAKAVGPQAEPGEATTAEPDSALLTEEGLVLGTPVYMSPEQARGRPVDRRTDLWSLGCVLYECLSGRRPFSGANPSDVIAALLKDEPDWSALPRLPARVDELLRRCLAKDARMRLRDAGEARVQLQLALDALAAGELDAPPQASTARAGRARVWLPALGALALGGVLGVMFGPRAEAGPGGLPATAGAPAPKQLHYVLHDFGNEVSNLTSLSISPDGSHVAWTANDHTLQIQPLGALEPVVLRNRQGVRNHTWSPDSKQLAWIEDREIWRVDREGGPPVRILSLGEQSGVGELCWADDSRLILTEGAHVTSRSITGDVTRLLESPEEAGFHFDAMDVLPEGGGALLIRHPVGGEQDTVVHLRDGRLHDVLRLDGWRLLDLDWVDGRLWLLNSQGEESRWWWVDFDPTSDTPPGEPQSTMITTAYAAFAADGTVVTAAQDGRRESQLAYIDLDGTIEAFGRRLPGMGILAPRDDGEQLLHTTLEKNGSTTSVWSHDYARGISTFLTSVDTAAPFVVPMGDGSFSLADAMSGKTALHPAGGRGEPEPMSDMLILDVAPDGPALLFESLNTISNVSLYWDDLRDDAEPKLIKEGANVGLSTAALSPDGRWLLLCSAESGEEQIYLSRFPPTGEQWQVSVDGANAAFFSPEQDAIYVMDNPFPLGSGVTVSRTSFTASPEVRLGVPEKIFNIEGRQLTLRGFAPDGERLIGSIGHSPAARNIVVRTGWSPAR